LRGDSKLRGFWNGDEKDHFEHYRDVGEDENVAQIEDAIAKMKSIPIGVLRRGQHHSQIGASSSNYYSSEILPSNAPGQLYAGQASASSIPPDSNQQAMEWNPAPDQLYAGQTSASSIPQESDQQAMEWNPAPDQLYAGQASASSIPPNSGFQPASALQNKNYVEVTLVKTGQDIAHNTYRFQTQIGPVEKLGSEFVESIDPQGSPCMAYYGSRSQIWYWTRSLDPESGYVVFKGKGKESGKRRH
jgi:hypothetical protein